MDLHEAIRIRRSVRSYLPTAIPREIINRILEAGRLAPSASNRMPWRFIVVTDDGKRAALAASGIYGRFLTQCPVVIVGCGSIVAASKWYAVDTAIALEHIVLAATAEGLGSCWIGSFDETTVKSLLRIPDEYRVVAMVALGYPAEKSSKVFSSNGSRRPLKSMQDIAASEEFPSAWK